MWIQPIETKRRGTAIFSSTSYSTASHIEWRIRLTNNLQLVKTHWYDLSICNMYFWIKMRVKVHYTFVGLQKWSREGTICSALNGKTHLISTVFEECDFPPVFGLDWTRFECQQSAVLQVMRKKSEDTPQLESMLNQLNWTLWFTAEWKHALGPLMHRIL